MVCVRFNNQHGRYPELAREQIAILTDTLEKHKNHITELQEEHNNEQEKAQKMVVKLQADLDQYTKAGPPGTVAPEALVAALRNECRQEFAVLRDRTSSFEDMESRLLHKMDKQKGGESLVYNRHKEAVRLLGRKPEIFERPTVLTSAKDHIASYIEYAKSIHADSDYYIDGYAQFLKGESLDYYESYRAVTKIQACLSR